MVFYLLIVAADHSDTSSGSIAESLMGTVGILFFGVIAWFYQRTGGVLLFFHGLVLIVIAIFAAKGESPVAMYAFTAMFSLPLLVSGVLFFINGQREKKLTSGAMSR
jgi:hypothetical protein